MIKIVCRARRKPIPIMAGIVAPHPVETQACQREWLRYQGITLVQSLLLAEC